MNHESSSANGNCTPQAEFTFAFSFFCLLFCYCITTNSRFDLSLGYVEGESAFHFIPMKVCALCTRCVCLCCTSVCKKELPSLDPLLPISSFNRHNFVCLCLFLNCNLSFSCNPRQVVVVCVFWLVLRSGWC